MVAERDPPMVAKRDSPLGRVTFPCTRLSAIIQVTPGTPGQPTHLSHEKGLP